MESFKQIHPAIRKASKKVCCPINFWWATVGAEMIIATTNSKGGVGKTTIAVHLADWLRIHGYKVVLVDCDAQRQSSEWLNELPDAYDSVVVDSPAELKRVIPVLRKKHHAIVIDAPGGLGEITGAILKEADAVLIPTGPSNLDIKALEWTTKTIHEVQALRGERKPHAAIIPVKANERRVTTRHLIQKAEGYGFGITSVTLPSREIYLAVSGLENNPPRLLWGLGKSRAVRQAALEMDAVFREVLPEACAGHENRIEKLVTPKVRRKKKGKADVETSKAAG